MTNSSQIKVWDPLVRFFHWSLVSAFIIAFITEDDFLSIHSWAGYLILALLIIRFVWGFVGTRYARFSDFVYSIENIKQFLKDTLSLKAKRYIGHNPAGGAMVVLLMLSLLMTTTTGILVLGAEEHAGPVAHWFSETNGFWGSALENLHEFFANFTLLLVFVHVAGVLVESLIHKENLVSAMLTGFKNKEVEED
ncbi:MAG: cytochrome B [endosymbiont of Galathealinum brachiosum]|uniref:Cytochrome B n=1 Tax=endosymbiont of Galathealinum brachiosum TaxID=2200906 RepID=A0A370DEA0_9GAMM|nr:MAG: cytochrome B [endosymbiont of Galathealinum brachiosum]